MTEQELEILADKVTAGTATPEEIALFVKESRKIFREMNDLVEQLRLQTELASRQ